MGELMRGRDGVENEVERLGGGRHALRFVRQDEVVRSDLPGHSSQRYQVGTFVAIMIIIRMDTLPQSPCVGRSRLP